VVLSGKGFMRIFHGFEAERTGMKAPETNRHVSMNHQENATV